MAKIVMKFALSLRANSLVDHLKANSIESTVTRPKWTNKRLPPPKIEVTVDDEDYPEAKALAAGDDW